MGASPSRRALTGVGNRGRAAARRAASKIAARRVGARAARRAVWEKAVLRRAARGPPAGAPARAVRVKAAPRAARRVEHPRARRAGRALARRAVPAQARAPYRGRQALVRPVSPPSGSFAAPMGSNASTVRTRTLLVTRSSNARRAYGPMRTAPAGPARSTPAR